jgi:hypothetical protein
MYEFEQVDCSGQGGWASRHASNFMLTAHWLERFVNRLRYFRFLHPSVFAIQLNKKILEPVAIKMTQPASTDLQPVIIKSECMFGPS